MATHNIYIYQRPGTENTAYNSPNPGSVFPHLFESFFQEKQLCIFSGYLLCYNENICKTDHIIGGHGYG